MGATSRVRADILFAVVDLFVVAFAYFLALGFIMADTYIGWSISFFFRNLALALPIIVVVHLIYNIWTGAYGHVSKHGRHSQQTPAGRSAGLFRVALANIAACATLLFLLYLARTSDILIIPFAVILFGGLLSLFGMGLVRFQVQTAINAKDG